MAFHNEDVIKLQMNDCELVKLEIITGEPDFIQ
jgi:hypothetical protein